jgi:hypothetical protein
MNLTDIYGIRSPYTVGAVRGFGKGYGTNPVFSGGDVAPGGGFTNPRILPDPPPQPMLGGTLGVPDYSPAPIGLPDPTKGYGTNPPILGGGDVAPGGGFVNPRLPPPRYGINPPVLGGTIGGYPKDLTKGYGNGSGVFGGGDVAPGGGFTNPRFPYSSLTNIYKGVGNLA